MDDVMICYHTYLTYLHIPIYSTLLYYYRNTERNRIDSNQLNQTGSLPAWIHNLMSF
ncbi:hypothetical protein ASPTUDRAFT_45618 [Aspergillus tubingensis CBS 134.48]|uniref:Uncharacterized protein n=1 Tax=Aspergillus tubingensis (strain CBS 134.48) TaxID=767770 RepID=A0A1L9MZ84_ASPTC|nr:hypothetical protein ASPTUDRAFT_45618 [Aspergillus tubingensis CBS 134.48]